MLYNDNFLKRVLYERQKKYASFLPSTDEIISQLSDHFESNQDCKATLQSWKESKCIDHLKELYNYIMKNRLIKNVGYIRRYVLYLYVVEKVKQECDDSELDWIETELFSCCIYENFENIYLSFVIWRIKNIINKIKVQDEDVNYTIKNTWMDCQEDYKRALSKYQKLKSLVQLYSSDQFHWFRAELYVLDVIFSLEKNLSTIEKSLIAYQLYRSYHSSSYHIKCGDTLYKMLYFINHNLPTDVLVQLYNMIIVCYNKYIQDGNVDSVSEKLSFTIFNPTRKAILNKLTYSDTIKRLLSISNTSQTVDCYDKFCSTFEKNSENQNV